MSFRLALILSAGLSFAVFKLVHLGATRVNEFATGWLLDLCVWFLLWSASEWCLRSQRPLVRSLGQLGFYPAIYLLMLVSFGHSYFFDEAVDRKLSLLDVQLEGIVYFLQHVLPVEGVLALLALGSGLHFGAWLIKRLCPSPPRRTLGRAALALLASTAVSLAVAPVESPFVDIVTDLYEVATTPHLTPLPVSRLPFSPRVLDRREPVPDASFTTPFDKVLVFVMETTTHDDLENQRKRLAPNTFARAALPHAHRYTRYFPGNQDSRTGMLGMLSARFNPYEAYTDEAVAKYKDLARPTSLVDHMRKLGFRSAFALSQVELELVVRDLGWDEVMHLSEAESARAKQQFLCFHPYEFEHSCEDLALLPKVLDFLDRSPRAFLYQEFVWGHSHLYNDAAKKTNAQYYSSYVDAVIAHLRARGELAKSLIVLVSDHGYRDKQWQADPTRYQIPLWFYAEHFAPKEDARLLSHLDFKDLLFAEMADRAWPISPNPFVMMTGATGSSLWAVMTEQSDFMLIKSRGDVHLLLSHANWSDPAQPRRREDLTLPQMFLSLRSAYLLELAAEQAQRGPAAK
jgi:hypothetical protein